MADRKEELKKAKEAGESIVDRQFGEKQEPTNTSRERDIKKMNHGHGSILYHYDGKGYKTMEEAQKAKDAREGTKPADKPGSSLVAQQFADNKSGNKEKTFADVKAENGNDPAKTADYLNNNPDYKPGEDGKWSASATAPTTTTTGTETETSASTTNVTNDDVLDRLDMLSAENENLRKMIESLTNPETGDVDPKKAKSTVSQYEQKMVEQGAADIDKDGNFKLKNVNKSGWEDIATMFSAGLSMLGLAMGIPIIPINFRKTTGKDARDKKVRELQKQYTDILATNTSKVKDVESSIEAGNLAGKNKEAIKNYSDYTENVGAYKSKSDIDTDASTELIGKQTAADMKKAQQQIQANEKIVELEMKHAKEMEKLSSDLSTASAKDLTAYSRSGWIVDYVKAARAEGLTNKEIALAMAGLNGVTPTQMGLKNAEAVVGMVTKTADSVSNFIPGKGK